MPDLIQLDQSLFIAINKGLSNPFFDWLMPFLRNRYLWTPLYLFISIFLVRNYGRLGWRILLFFALSFAVADYFSSSIVKPAFARLRPCNDPEMKSEINTLIACGSGYSFPSTHAANHFALAVFLTSMFYRRWKAILPLAILWAASVSFAQIYVGVHYPFDILAGAVIGGMIGYCLSAVLLSTQSFKKWNPGN